ncbi:unnamed protein product, partial [Ectocarpus sp. 12 AP-2014]
DCCCGCHGNVEEDNRGLPQAAEDPAQERSAAAQRQQQQLVWQLQQRQHAQQQEQQLNRASLSPLRPATASATRKTQLSPSAPSYFPPSMTA